MSQMLGHRNQIFLQWLLVSVCPKFRRRTEERLPYKWKGHSLGVPWINLPAVSATAASQSKIAPMRGIAGQLVGSQHRPGTFSTSAVGGFPPFLTWGFGVCLLLPSPAQILPALCSGITNLAGMSLCSHQIALPAAAPPEALSSPSPLIPRGKGDASPPTCRPYLPPKACFITKSMAMAQGRSPASHLACTESGNRRRDACGEVHGHERSGFSRRKNGGWLLPPSPPPSFPVKFPVAVPRTPVLQDKAGECQAVRGGEGKRAGERRWPQRAGGR